MFKTLSEATQPVNVEVENTSELQAAHTSIKQNRMPSPQDVARSQLDSKKFVSKSKCKSKSAFSPHDE